MYKKMKRELYTQLPMRRKWDWAGLVWLTEIPCPFLSCKISGAQHEHKLNHSHGHGSSNHVSQHQLTSQSSKALPFSLSTLSAVINCEKVGCHLSVDSRETVYVYTFFRLTVFRESNPLTTVTTHGWWGFAFFKRPFPACMSDMGFTYILDTPKYSHYKCSKELILSVCRIN